MTTSGPPDVLGTHQELAALGLPSDRRVGPVAGDARAVPAAVAGEEPGVDVLPRPTRPEGPPLWLGAHGPRMLRLAGPHFDGWLPFAPTPAQYVDGIRALREAAEVAGRDPEAVETAAYLTVAVADTAREAEEELDTYMRAYYGQPAKVMAEVQACHAATLDSAAEWLAAYVAAGVRPA